MRALIDSLNEAVGKGSPFAAFVGFLKDGLKGGSVSGPDSSGKIRVTGPDKAEVVGAIKTAMSLSKKKDPGFSTSFAWEHKPGKDGYTVILTATL